MVLNPNAAPYVPPPAPVVAPPAPNHPALPVAVAPAGYFVARGWHWGYDAWANNVQWNGQPQGYQPHFNIQPNGGGNMLHAYYAPGYNGMVINVFGTVLAYF